MNYFKTFDETRINYDLYTLNPSDSISLLEIGNKCPLYDGSVVFEARIMYGAIYGLDYQFSDACETDSTRGEKRLSQNLGDNKIEEEINVFIKDVKTSIYPNPSSGEVFIKSTCLANIEIFDLQGRIIPFEKISINENLIKLLIKSNNGIYTFKLIEGENIIIRKIQLLK